MRRYLFIPALMLLCSLGLFAGDKGRDKGRDRDRDRYGYSDRSGYYGERRGDYNGAKLTGRDRAAQVSRGKHKGWYKNRKQNRDWDYDRYDDYGRYPNRYPNRVPDGWRR